MGKGTDKLYITHSEWSSADAYGASVGANAGTRAQRSGAHASFKRLPFNFCAASLQPFKNPVCTADGTIFDVEVIGAWLEKKGTNPVDGKPLAKKDLIKLNFARNADTTESNDRNGIPTDGKGDFIDPVTFKVFTDNTHIVAIRHGTYANVFAWETVERMNIKAKMWRDLVDDVEFGRKDIITLQDPQNAASRDLSQFKHIQDGEEAALTPEQTEQRQEGGINIDALGRIGDKVLRAKEAVARARQARESGTDINHTTSKSLSKPSTTTTTPVLRQSLIQEKKKPANSAIYTTGAAAASFTSTGLTPSTSGSLALLSEEEYLLKPRRLSNAKHPGFVRVSTTLGDLTLELLPEFAPKAVWNFLRLAQKGYYNNTLFHRNIKNFMIQGGDPTGTGRGGTSIWKKTFNDELEGPLTHDARGVVSMANKGKNTNSSQFFITYRPAKHLDKKHTIFGRVVDSEGTMTKMESARVGGDSRPVEEIRIVGVTVLIDPFEEFLKEKKEKEAKEEERREVERRGGTEDDRTTWTGKRLRGDEGGSKGGGVGKYLQQVKMEGKKQEGRIEEEEWEEPVKKKTKVGGGFGNFDGW
ncbi:putative peptidyl-prolyl cis-trans isomerase [Triangularia verruculosa]|uniref:Peptidyl-prolyl cis-trans isomerase-like 2 n=1 Tax=Triangularia verruculosa TaxID=2587418 RepID=A0AAN7APA0_9PEZI|nr:putative peptidyl-prolyl cis-trans isomerase [Triangularia verruculosa]